MQSINGSSIDCQEISHQAPAEPTSIAAASEREQPQIARIRDLRGITASAKLALLILQSRQPHIFPSMRLIAEDMGVSFSTAKRAIRELKLAGYVQVAPRIGRSNLYSISVEGGGVKTESGGGSSVSNEAVKPKRGAGSNVTQGWVIGEPGGGSSVTSIRSNLNYKEARKPARAKHTSKARVSCPKCERSWPADYGSVCHDCDQDVSTIKRKMATQQQNIETQQRQAKQQEQGQQDEHAKRMQRYQHVWPASETAARP